MESVNHFKALFNLICLRHAGPVIIDMGRQMVWNGIVAGQCTRHIQFIQADGIDAVLDTRINKLRFNEGSADMLQAILAQQMEAVSATVQ